MLNSLVNIGKSVINTVSQTSTSSFPYTIGSEISGWKQCKNTIVEIWTLYEGTKNGTNEKVTIFALENRKTKSQNIVDAALNCYNELKKIRHPNILQYKDGIITDDKIYFVTEYVYPLVLNSTSNRFNINESFIALGIYQICIALSFIHSSLNYLHCNVSPYSIFISLSGEFKLGGMELYHKSGEIPNYFTSLFNNLLPLKYKPKEYINNGNIINNLLNSSASASELHTLDAWCCGCLIYELFSLLNNKIFTKPQQLSSINIIPQQLRIYYKKLLATKPSSRIKLNDFINECSWIKNNSLVQTSLFLDCITIKSDNEKRQFLQHLDCNISYYPPQICKYKIFPSLTHLLEHGFGSNPLILSCVLKISSINNNDTDINIRPLVINMFRNNERGTRINLLKSLPKFIQYLDNNTISNDIWPQLINGFTDSSPILREQSVRSVIFITPKLNNNIISSQLLPLLDKLQSSDIEAAIRTNTIIVLGKITKYCNNNGENELLLVKCFARAINDKFIPCRNAGLLSLSASINTFNENTIANKILPGIIKYTLDNNKDVRESTFKCIQIGLNKLKQNSLTRNNTKSLQNNNNNTKQDDNTTSSSSSSSSMVGSAIGSVGSWAVSKISGYSANDNDNNNNELRTTHRNNSSSTNSSNSNGKPKNSLNLNQNKTKIKTKNKHKNKNENANINKNNDVDLDKFFGKTSMKLKNNKKDSQSSIKGIKQIKQIKQTKQNSVGNWLEEFTKDLNKEQNEKSINITSSIKKSKKKKKLPSKTVDKNNNLDDFFNDW